MAASSDPGAAVAQLAGELLNGDVCSADVAAASLEGLRQRLHAAQALLWLCDAAGARRVLQVGDANNADPPAVIDFEDTGLNIHRLRHKRIVLCRPGYVSGLECFAPSGIASFAAVTTGNNPVTGLLVIAWTDSTSFSNADLTPLQIAATLLVQSLRPSGREASRDSLPNQILSSLPDRIAVVDRDGTIIAVNRAWTAFGRHQGIGSLDLIGPGANYLEVCDRAAVVGYQDAPAVSEGIRAVCEGSRESFEAVYRSGLFTDEQWSLTVTSLRRPEGGAVIAHTPVTQPKLAEFATLADEARWDQLVNTVPVPVWVARPDGRVIYGNDAWGKATGSGPGLAMTPADWTAAAHPDDRDGATAAFDSAVSRCEPFTFELRLKGSDGTYRWWTCTGGPRLASDGGLESYVGVCHDITGQRLTQSKLGELATKLVTAQESERTRIARELHDDLGQQVALLLVKLETQTSARTESKRKVAEMRELTQTIATGLHRISHRLHPGRLKLLGLVQTLDTMCRAVSTESGLNIGFRADSIPQVVSEDATTCLFRVAQEALHNSIKHSGATTIDVRLSSTTSNLTLSVVDNGGGFEPLASHWSGLGLLTMRERVELLGGLLRITSGPETGTTVEATVPLSVRAPRGHMQPTRSSGQQTSELSLQHAGRDHVPPNPEDSMRRVPRPDSAT